MITILSEYQVLPEILAKCNFSIIIFLIISHTRYLLTVEEWLSEKKKRQRKKSVHPESRYIGIWLKIISTHDTWQTNVQQRPVRALRLILVVVWFYMLS